MKRLIIVRHAKSDWSQPGLADIDRPLNKRGKQNAPFMAQKLLETCRKPDILISSTAKRARKTARTFAEILGMEHDIQLEEKIYDAVSDDILEVVQEINGDIECAALFGHNPGMIEFINMVSQDKIEKFPTCAVAELEFNVESFSDIHEESGRLVNYLYPKMYK